MYIFNLILTENLVISGLKVCTYVLSLSKKKKPNQNIKQETS